MWFLNPRLSAREALEIGLINKVVADDKLEEETRAMAEAVAERGAFALAALKGAFVARHGGVSGLSRVSHDLLLRLYLDTDESKELGEAFRGKRSPDPDKFGH
jgi:naphthoate synthase